MIQHSAPSRLAMRSLKLSGEVCRCRLLPITLLGKRLSAGLQHLVCSQVSVLRLGPELWVLAPC